MLHPLLGQQPAFDVTSVKPSNSGTQNTNFGLAGGRFTATNAPLREIVRTAYEIPDQLIVNAPGLDTSPLDRRLTIQKSPRPDAEIIWVLDNRGDHTPPPGTREAWRGQFVPYSELDRFAMKLLRWPVQPTHVLALTKYPLN